MNKIIEKVVGDLGDKRRWRQYKARVKELPEPYRATCSAVERYAMYFSGITNGNTMMTMLDNLIDLFEEHAADGTPIRQIVGEDPVEFAETFLANYSQDHWIAKERRRLQESIRKAAGETS
ncbi:DUF1048 domain-containing protein [Ruania alkalisoli]|uniref:DUF1048 domain-containing protein n=1 Tax=Ruania alkalisoli TaxID=2779775 RepID=A0A7M1SZK3_9MICO|nr:DUF1048 domain-containing protein [Ruania alkalisoli]QOR72394.1 DUF1048 domain-containing protein [Ruania alkalisoli]